MTNPQDFSEAELRQIDLNLLLVFSAVMRTGSVQGAARRLFLGPSGVSMALSRLRKVVGRELFIRGRDGLEPTAFARSMYGKIEPALRDLSTALKAHTAFNALTYNDTYRIALSDDLEVVLGPRLHARLALEAPNVRLVLRAGDYRRVGALLDGGEAHLVLTARPARLEARHRAQILYQDKFAALCDGKKFGLKEPLSLETYVTLPHAIVSAAGGLRGLVDDALAVNGLNRQVTIAVEHFTTLPFLLKSGKLLASVPTVPAQVLARTFELTSFALPFPSPSFEIIAAWHARLDEDPAHVWFRAMVVEEVARLRREA